MVSLEKRDSIVGNSLYFSQKHLSTELMRMIVIIIYVYWCYLYSLITKKQIIYHLSASVPLAETVRFSPMRNQPD